MRAEGTLDGLTLHRIRFSLPKTVQIREPGDLLQRCIYGGEMRVNSFTGFRTKAGFAVGVVALSTAVLMSAVRGPSATELARQRAVTPPGMVFVPAGTF